MYRERLSSRNATWMENEICDMLDAPTEWRKRRVKINKINKSRQTREVNKKNKHVIDTAYYNMLVSRTIKRTRWSITDTTELVLAYNNNKTHKEMAVQFGRTTDAIDGKLGLLRKAGIKLNRYKK